MEERKSRSEYIVYVEPNYKENFITYSDGDSTTAYQEYVPNTEDMCVAVNLIVKLPSKNSQGTNEDETISVLANSNGDSTISFFRGTNLNGKYRLSTTPYEFTTVKDISKSMKVDENGEFTEDSYVPNEMFGITNIDVSFDTYQTVQVNMDFVDIHGISLFAAEQLSHNGKSETMRGIDTNDVAGSFFKCFFMVPYPVFLFKMKGFYGRPTSYILSCADFKASFDCKTGNFNATVRFVGFQNAFFQDVTVAMLANAAIANEQYWNAQSGSVFTWEDDVTEGSTPMVTIHSILNAYLSIKKQILQLDRDISEQQAIIDEGENKKQRIQSLIDRIKTLVSYFSEQDKLIQYVLENGDVATNATFFKQGCSQYAKNLFKSKVNSKTSLEETNSYAFIILPKLSYIDNGKVLNNLEWYVYGNYYEAKMLYLKREVNAIHEELTSIDENYKGRLKIFELGPITENAIGTKKVTTTHSVSVQTSTFGGTTNYGTASSVEEIPVYLYSNTDNDSTNKFYNEFCKGRKIITVKITSSDGHTEPLVDNVQHFQSADYTSTEYFTFDPCLFRNKEGKQIVQDTIEGRKGLLGQAKYFGVANYQKVIDDLNAKLGNVPNEVSGAQSAINALTEQRQQLIDNKFGFKPTVHNIVKLLFAHLETFVNMVKTYSDEANNSDRTMTSIGLEDVDLNILDSEKVGAFPRVLGTVTENGQTRVEDVWLGKLSGGAEQPETKLTQAVVEASNNYASQAISIERVRLETDEELAEDNSIQIDFNETTETVLISAYKYLKTIYDKWLSSQEYTQFDIENYFKKHVHFIDEYYCHIKDDVCVDMVEFCEFLSNVVAGRDVNYGLLSFLSMICGKNFISVTAIQNFLDFTKRDKNGKDEMSMLFDAIPFSEVSQEMTNMHFDLPDLVFLQIIEGSNKATDSSSIYRNDSFKIASAEYDKKLPLPIQLVKNGTGNKDEDDKRLKIPSFGVTYGMQYQSYFKDISINMDHATATEATIRAQVNIAESAVDSGGGTKANIGFTGQDLFTIWSNNAFECTVTMMGNAYIQPLMYFQLNNIPMFDGTYIIYNVKHSISSGQMTTKFTGNRLCRVQNPRAKDGAFIHLGVLDANGELIQEKDIASIYNDCHYAYYKPGSASFKNGGGITDTWLNASLEQIAGSMYGKSLKTAKKENAGMPSVDVLKQKYSVCTIFDALCCAAWGAVGDATEAAIALTFATYVNRWYDNGKKYVEGDFAYNQIEWDTNQGYYFLLGLKYGDYSKVPKKNVDDLVEKAKKYLTNPLAAVGLESKTTWSFDLSNGGTYTFGNSSKGVHTATKTITEEMVQKVNGYATANDIGWYHWMKTLAREKIHYICHCSFGSRSHIFANLKGGKSFWTSDSLVNASTSDGGVEYTENTYPCLKAKELFDSIVSSCNDSDKTNVSDIKIESYPEDKYGFYMTCNPATGACQLFDIVLQTYYDDIDTIQWLCKNDSTENAFKIYVRASDGKDTTKWVSIGKTKEVPPRSEDMSIYNNLFKMSVYKKTRDNFVKNFDEFKKVYKNFDKVDSANAQKILDGLECGVESCSEILESMRPSPTTMECSYDGGSFNYTPTTKDGSIVYVLYRYKRQNGTINGFIYDTSTNKILCDTIENETYYTNPFKGSKVNTIVSGCSSWYTEKQYRASQNTLARQFASGDEEGKCHMLQIGTSGCLFHLGANKSWSKGCILVCSNPNGLEAVDDYVSSADIDSVNKIKQLKSGQAFMILYKTTYDYLKEGKTVKLEFVDAFATKNSALPPYGNGQISCKEKFINTGIGSLAISSGSFKDKTKNDNFKTLGIENVNTEDQSMAYGKTSNIIDVTLPHGWGTIRIHRGVAEDLISIINDIHQNVPSFRGSISSSFRTSTTNGKLSNHGRGIAIDINAGSGGNPWFKHDIKKGDWTYNKPNGSAKPWSIKQTPYSGTYDKDKCIWSWDHPVVQIFNSHGWGWGGAYGDTMHFSLSVYKTSEGMLVGG